MKDLLGGKGANLAEMANLGLPVPPGFTITTAVCTHYYANKQKYPKDLEKQVDAGLAHIAAHHRPARFGDRANPLLVSVRSGARASMPGMMDTVLNLGLNDETVEALAKQSGDRRFAYDSYRRFIQMYSNVVLDIEHHNFEDILEDHKSRAGFTLDTELTADDWVDVVARYQERVREEKGEPFPQDPRAQLWGAIGAVFGSWMNARAITYRRLHAIPESWGTAVNVQAMVFGNMGDTSATGRRLHAQSLDRREAALRRIPDQRPGRGRRRRHPHAAGDHRDRAQGIRLRQAVDGNRDARAFKELTRIYGALEKHYRDMQDMEFTVEQGKLWMLQTRNGKRTAKAALRIAVELANEKLITRDEAVARIEPGSLDQLLHPTIDPKAERNVIATGLPASPGAASGEIVFKSDEATKAQGRRQEGHPGAGRDLARRHPRHARRRRHPDDARRHDLARGRRRARHGQALRLRRGLAARRLQRADLAGRQRRAQARRDRHHRRLDRPGAGRRRADDRAGDVGRVRHPDGLGRQGAQARRARQCRYAGRRAGRASSSAPKASGSAAPSICSSTRRASRRCAR